MSLKLKYHHSSFNDFTSGEQSVVENIADKCLYQYPDPVVLARSLRMTYDTTITQYSDICTEEIPIELRTHIADEVKLYPNPVTQSLNVKLIQENETKRFFDIINNTGQVMKTISVENTLKIDLKDYPSGIYFLKDRSGVLKTKKFIVMK